MRHFSPDQLIFALVLGAIIFGIFVYRIFFLF